MRARTRMTPHTARMPLNGPYYGLGRAQGLREGQDTREGICVALRATEGEKSSWGKRLTQHWR